MTARFCSILVGAVLLAGCTSDGATNAPEGTAADKPTASVSAPSPSSPQPDGAGDENAFPGEKIAADEWDETTKTWTPKLSAKDFAAIKALDDSDTRGDAMRAWQEGTWKCMEYLGYSNNATKIDDINAHNAAKSGVGSLLYVQLPGYIARGLGNKGCDGEANKAVFGDGDEWLATNAYVEYLLRMVDTGQVKTPSASQDAPADHPAKKWMQLVQKGFEASQNTAELDAKIKASADKLAAEGYAKKQK